MIGRMKVKSLADAQTEELLNTELPDTEVDFIFSRASVRAMYVITIDEEQFITLVLESGEYPILFDQHIYDTLAKQLD